MGKTLLDLAKNLRKRVAKIDLRASEVSKEIALEIVKQLVLATPVDTSKALSNWQIGIGKPVSNERGPYVPGDFGSTQGQSASATIANAELWLSAKKPGEPIFVSNLVDYIVDLNQGTSTQAPVGFVEDAVRIAYGRVKGARLRI